MELWFYWSQAIFPLRSAFSRTITFQWFFLFLIGLTIRTDLAGVTSIIRVLGLSEKAYDRLLAMIHSSSINLELLTKLWIQSLLKLIPQIQTYEGRHLLIADGVKAPKSGKRMPAVRLHHQVSESNTKPEFIMGHSFQAVAFLAGNDLHSFAIPIASRIHEGVRWFPNDKSTLLDKLLSLVMSLKLDKKFILIADAYYASGSLIKQLTKNGNHLVTRVRNNAVAFETPSTLPSPGKRGRKRIYGKKIKLFGQWEHGFDCVASPWEPKITIRIKSLDLFWRKAQQLVRFVWVDHPQRGRILILCSDLSIPPIEIAKLYAKRFKIEIAFKQAIRSLGLYSYHFWSRIMKPTKRREKDRFLHKESEIYKKAIQRKIHAFHIFVQAGIIVQGSLQYLSLCHTQLVWKNFGSWLRTIRPDAHPSESVTSCALRSSMPQFLADTPDIFPCKLLLHKYADPVRSSLLKAA